MRVWLGLVGVWLIAGQAGAVPARDNVAGVVAANTYPMSIDGARLGGPAAQFLTKATADAQFVLAGENHHDYFTPLFDLALFHMLHDAHGYDHVAVEQDPLAIEQIEQPGLRGDAAAMGRMLRDYRVTLGFASDQDLAFLAGVEKTTPVWGLEQTQSPVYALEELRRLAPDGRTRADSDALLQAARAKAGRIGFVDFLALDASTYPRLQALAAEFHASRGSRAEAILTGLVKSAEIYSYYRRGGAGEPVGLYNNTVREAWLKQGFSARTRAAQADGRLRVLFKFGENHMIDGLNPVGAFSLGSFLHELAIWNGQSAYGIEVITLGAYTKAADLAALRPILPPGQTTPVVIDLRPFRPIAKAVLAQVSEADRATLRAHIFGFDAIAFFPNSRKATWSLTGFAPP
jgi:hypothetical protein